VSRKTFSGRFDVQELLREALHRRRKALSDVTVFAPAEKTNKRRRVDPGTSSANQQKNNVDAPDDSDDEGTVFVPEPLMQPSQESLKQLLNELKAIAQRIDIPAAEASLCRIETQRVNKLIDQQIELLNLLDREAAATSRLANKRIGFYRTLQRLSDDVAIPTDIIDIDAAELECHQAEATACTQVHQEEGKLRYLNHLESTVKDDAPTSDECDDCYICRAKLSEVNQIMVTKCGVRCFVCSFSFFPAHLLCGLHASVAQGSCALPNMQHAPGIRR
jgi:E3 ubiquitin-protein ligase SHPRH